MIDNKVEAIKYHIEEIMDILGIEITESNKGTPLRVAKMWCNELFENRNNNNLEELNSRMKLFPNEYDEELIVMKDIEFNSTCEHHWLPFSGKVTVAYAPCEKVIGLSKIPRVVKYFSRRPQLQEQLTKEIGEYLFDILEPHALFVKVEATHQCVKCRGAESDCNTITFFRRGEHTDFYYKDFRDRM